MALLRITEVSYVTFSDLADCWFKCGPNVQIWAKFWSSFILIFGMMSKILENSVVFFVQLASCEGLNIHSFSLTVLCWSWWIQSLDVTPRILILSGPSPIRK